MTYRVNFESDDESVAIHVTVDERVEDEYIDGDEFLRDVLAGFEDTFGKSWDEGIELGTSSNGLDCPTVIFSMPGGLGDLVGIIGLHGNYDSVFRDFVEEAVEKAHGEAMERRREVFRAGERPKIVRRLCEVAITRLISSASDDVLRGIDITAHGVVDSMCDTPLTQEIAAGVFAEFMAKPVGFLIGQLRAPMPESAATPAALSTAKMPDDWQTSKALDAIKVPGVDEAEPEPNGPTDPEGPKSTDPDSIPWGLVDVEQSEPEPEPEFNEEEFRKFHAGRAGNAGDWIALVEARGTVTLTEAAEALGVETRSLGGITGGITRASNSRNVVVPIETSEDESGERFWTWTGPKMDLGWTDPEPTQVKHEIVEVEVVEDDGSASSMGEFVATIPDGWALTAHQPVRIEAGDYVVIDMDPDDLGEGVGQCVGSEIMTAEIRFEDGVVEHYAHNLCRTIKRVEKVDDRQTDITDFIEPGATANDPESPIGDGVDEDPFVIDEEDAAAVEDHIAEVVEAEIVTSGTDEAEPEPNGPTDPGGDADAVLSHEKIIALNLDSDEKKVLRFIASAGPVTQEQIEESIGAAWMDIAKGIYKKWGMKHGRTTMLIHFDFETLAYSINTDVLG